MHVPNEIFDEKHSMNRLESLFYIKGSYNKLNDKRR